MRTYLVNVMGIYDSTVEVEANSEEEAIDNILNGEGGCISPPAFIEYINTPYWTVEEVQDE